MMPLYNEKSGTSMAGTTIFTNLKNGTTETALKPVFTRVCGRRNIRDLYYSDRSGR